MGIERQLMAGRLVLWLIGLYPLVAFAWMSQAGEIGPDPGKELVDHLGLWALRFLLLTLTLRPLAELVKRPLLVRLRRPAGLFCLFYATLHLAGALFYLLGWTWPDLVTAVAERTYVLLGFGAWLLLLPLGVTSTRRAQRHLGPRWRRLHRLIYPASLLALAHFIWLVRSDFREPLLYALVLIALLGYRLARGPWMRNRRRSAP